MFPVNFSDILNVIGQNVIFNRNNGMVMAEGKPIFVNQDIDSFAYISFKPKESFDGKYNIGTQFNNLIKVRVPKDRNQPIIGDTFTYVGYLYRISYHRPYQDNAIDFEIYFADRESEQLKTV